MGIFLTHTKLSYLWNGIREVRSYTTQIIAQNYTAVIEYNTCMHGLARHMTALKNGKFYLTKFLKT